jgi:hypothetical protein
MKKSFFELLLMLSAMELSGCNKPDSVLLPQGRIFLMNRLTVC